MSTAERAVRATISGRVQGVGFRAWLQQAAEAHQVFGWVRNRADGAVEALLVGTPDAVEALYADCRRGPRHARVDTVRVDDVDLAARDRGGRFRVIAG